MSYDTPKKPNRCRKSFVCVFISLLNLVQLYVWWMEYRCAAMKSLLVHDHRLKRLAVVLFLHFYVFNGNDSVKWGQIHIFTNYVLFTKIAQNSMEVSEKLLWKHIMHWKQIEWTSNNIYCTFLNAFSKVPCTSQI